MENLQLALTIDLKQFLASLQDTEKFSESTVKQLQEIFAKVPSVQVPFDTQKLKKGLDDIERSTGPTVQQFNRIGQSAQSLNYIIRDSPFFFQRFDMGIMAVSNNLNPFIDDLIRAKAATGSWRNAVGTLTTGLMGVGGLSVAFSLIVAAIQAYSFWATNAARDTKGVREEVKDLNDEIKDMYDTQLKNEINRAKIRLWEIQDIRPEGGPRKVYDADTRTFSERPETPEERYGGFYNEVKELERKIQLYSREINSLGEIENIEKRIALNEKQRKELNEDNYKSYVKQAGSLKEAQKIMKEWIDADRKLITDSKTRFSPEKSLFTTNESIRAEIKQIDALLAGNLELSERIRLLERRVKLQKELTGVVEEYLKVEPKGNSIASGKFNMSFVENVPKPEAFKETNVELMRMLELSDMMVTSFNRAGDAVASAAAAGISLFKQENSLLQIFINNLIRATAEAITLKLVTTGLNIVGGLLGIPGLGSGVGAIAGAASGGGTRSVTAGGLNTLFSNSALRGGGFAVNYTNTSSTRPNVNAAQPVVVMADTVMRGRDIWLVQRKQESYRRKYYGSPD